MSSGFIKTIKTPSSIQWTIFEEFKFSENDFENIKEQGIDDSVQRKYKNEIKKYNNELTDIEIKYLSKTKKDIEKTKDIISRVLGEAENEANSRINNIEHSENFNLELLKNKTLSTINNIVSEFKTNINNTADPIIKARRYLRAFRAKNDLLDRDAEYAKSNILFIGTLFILLILETIANAYFYAQGNDLGLLGGAMQAFLVSIANVIISFTVGYILLRYLNNKSNFKKILSILGLIIAIPILGFLHLVTAHYRELLSKNVENINYEVLKQTWNNPFNINDLDSLVLIIIGVGISFFVMWKAYRVNDPYPGYAKKWKKWEKSEKKLSKYIDEYKNSLNKEQEIYQENASILNNNIKFSKDEFDKLITDFKSFKKTIARYMNNTINESNKIVNEYRSNYNNIAEANLLLVEEPIKKSIYDFLEFNEINKFINEKEETLKDLYNKFNNYVNEISSNNELVSKEIKNEIDSYLKDTKIKNMIDKAIKEADKKDIEEVERATKEAKVREEIKGDI